MLRIYTLVFHLNHLLRAEHGAGGEAGLSSGGLAQEGGASAAHNDGLSVAENSGDVDASGATDVHEVRVGRLDQSTLLVLGNLDLDIRVQQIVLNEL